MNSLMRDNQCKIEECSFKKRLKCLQEEVDLILKANVGPDKTCIIDSCVGDIGRDFCLTVIMA